MAGGAFHLRPVEFPHAQYNLHSYNLLVWRIGWGKISGVYAFTVVANWSSKELANSAITPGAVDKLPDSFTRNIYASWPELKQFLRPIFIFSLCVYRC